MNNIEFISTVSVTLESEEEDPCAFMAARKRVFKQRPMQSLKVLFVLWLTFMDCVLIFVWINLISLALFMFLMDRVPNEEQQHAKAQRTREGPLSLLLFGWHGRGLWWFRNLVIYGLCLGHQRMNCGFMNSKLLTRGWCVSGWSG